jgi:hypothetical protein
VLATVTFGQKKPAAHGFALMLVLPVARHEPAVHCEHAAALARSVVEVTVLEAEMVPVHVVTHGFDESAVMVMVLAATPVPERVAPMTSEPDATAVMVKAVPVMDPVATPAVL